MDLIYRPRRLRRTSSIRALVQETSLGPTDFIYPLFVHSGREVEPIIAMPGSNRWTLDALVFEVERAWKLGIRCIVLFPKIDQSLKSEDGAECFNEDGLIPRAIRLIKKELPEMIIMPDVALDPYSSDGHDGIVSNDGVILNDETIDILINQSLLQAEMGCDVLAPSDMMDGRIGKIRKALDSNNLQNTQILSYAVKYASSFYGPFRDAVGSKKI